MGCNEIRDQLLLGQTPSAELTAHVRECEACRALLDSQVAHDQAALSTLLALDEPHRPGPGFDTKFFAKLDEERTAHQKQRRSFSLRVWLWALVPAAVGIALLVTRASDPKPAVHVDAGAAALIAVVEEPDDLALLEELELVEDLELVQKLDELEDFEILADIEPTELDRIAQEQGTP